MEHTEIRRQLSAYLDGEVSPAQRVEIDAHLADCPRCRAALAELERTIGHIRNLPRVEAPPWLAAKTMARVREVAETRSSLWQRLFFPLGVKLPLEAVAIVFLCVTGYYLTRTSAPELTTVSSPVPSRQEAASPAQPAAPAQPEETPQPPAAVQRKAAPPTATPPAAPAVAPEKRSEAPALQAPAPAAPAPSYNAPSRARDELAPPMYEAEPDAASAKKAKRAMKAPSAASSAAQGVAPAPALPRYQAVLGVEDVGAAEAGASEAVRRAGGVVLRREVLPPATLLVVRLDSSRLQDLLARLERLGTLRQRPEFEMGANLELTIRLEQNR
jgi:hypothetical protein